MAYHIQEIDNQSDRSVALTNPNRSGMRDSVLIPPRTLYTPEHPPQLNTIAGNDPSYPEAAKTALNIYTKHDNYCFWDNDISSCNWMGENTPTIGKYNVGACSLKLTVLPDATIRFAKM